MKVQKKWLGLILTLLLSFHAALPAIAVGAEGTGDASAQADAQSETGETQEEYAEGRAIIKVSGEFFQKRAKRTASSFVYETLMELDSGSENGTKFRSASPAGDSIVLVQSDSMSTEELIQMLEEQPGVEYAEPDYVIGAYSGQYASSANEPGGVYFGWQWHLQSREEAAGSTNVPYIWDEDSGSPVHSTGTGNAVVAVLDSGIDYTNPDLAPNMWDDGNGFCGYDFSLSAESPEGDTDPMDVYGHGTHVAGIIGACGQGVSGMNPNIKLAALKVLGDDGSGLISAGIKAYDYICRHKEAGVNIVAANNSWGGHGPSKALEEAVDHAGQLGIISVMASGNEGQDNDASIQPPESGNPLASLTVNASDREGMAAPFSNFGQINTDLYAPGADIFSTYPVAKGIAYPVFPSGDANPAVVYNAEMSSVEEGSVEPVEESVSAQSGSVTLSLPSAEEPVLQWETTAGAVGDTLGIQWMLGDMSAFKDRANYLGLTLGVTDEINSERGRLIKIQVLVNGESGPVWADVSTADTSVEYGTPGPVTVSLMELKDSVIWEDFQIRILRTATQLDLEQTLAFRLEGMLLAEETAPYRFLSGTSMAAPMVTGAIALLSDAYGVSSIEDPEEQSQAMYEIRARLAGGVTRTEEMTDTCVSGGYLDLEKAVTSPYPVLDELVQEGSRGVLKGYFFGGEGTLTMDGEYLDVSEWTDTQITFTLPAGTAEGMHVFCVTDTETAADGSQYGQDHFQTEAVSPSAGGELFEKLSSPDLTQLGVELSFEQVNPVSVASVNGKVHVASDEFKSLSDAGEIRVLLAYDTASGIWSKAELPFIGADKLIQIASAGEKLYILENAETGVLVVHSYDPLSGDTEVLSEINAGEPFYNSGFICDGSSLWIVGGARTVDEETQEPIARVFSVNIENGIYRELPSLNVARSNPALGFAEGKLIVAGGENPDGQWESTTQIWDGAAWTQGSSFPEVYDNQVNMAASGTFGGKMIVSGMLSDRDHTGDTWVYDAQGDVWTMQPQKLDDTKVLWPGGIVSGDYFYVFGLTNVGNDIEYKFYRLKVQETTPGGGDTDPETPPSDTDEKTPSSDTDKKNPQSGKEEKAVKTGDSDNAVAILLLLLAVSAAVAGSAFGAILYRKGTR